MSNNRSANPVDPDSLADCLKALGNPQRLRLFLRLLACCPPGGAACRGSGETTRQVGEVGCDLGIAPSTVSHHLKELKRVGLIRCERRGRAIECCADPERVREVLAVFDPARLREEEIP
jgi:ArsR family transcriptional regulator